MTLELWTTPFVLERRPSVLLIPETHGASTATVVVSPSGVDAYPKYLVRFSMVYAFTSEEEAGGLSVYDGSVHGFPSERGCSYIWRDSPQSAEYSRLLPGAAPFDGRGPVTHYILCGADSNVGVVSAAKPHIERVDAPRSVTVTHEV